MLQVIPGVAFAMGTMPKVFFSDSELCLSINSKETLAIWYCLCAFRSLLCFSHVLILSDNMTAISYIHNMGDVF